jgi:hypothetical protein
MTSANQTRSCETARSWSTNMTAVSGRCTRRHATRTISSWRLLAFYGVGPVTANIFLRELRPFWPKADPEPLPVVAAVAAGLGIDLAQYKRKSLTFVRIESGLIRLRHEHRPPTTGSA